MVPVYTSITENLYTICLSTFNTDEWENSRKTTLICYIWWIYDIKISYSSANWWTRNWHKHFHPNTLTQFTPSFPCYLLIIISCRLNWYFHCLYKKITDLVHQYFKPHELQIAIKRSVFVCLDDWRYPTFLMLFNMY